MKAASVAAAAALLSVPILALPRHWPAGRAVPTRYVIDDPHGRGSRVVIACRPQTGAEILVSLDGTAAPPGSDIGFRSANRTIVMRTNDRGLIETRVEENREAYASLLGSLQTARSLEIGYTNGASADLPVGKDAALPGVAGCADDGWTVPPGV